MKSPLQRLYQTKLALLATVCTVAGVAFLLFAHWAERTTGAAWLRNLPVTDLGSALFTTGLLAIFFQYVGDQDAERRALQRERRVLTEAAPAIRDAVIQGFAFNADDLARVSSPVVLDDIARNVLTLQLGDRDLAAHAYDDLRAQVIQAPERWHDVGISIALAPAAPAATADGDAMFVATLHWEYRTIPVSPTVRFACVADDTEYHELLRDPAVTSVWNLGRPTGIDAGSRSTYELTQFAVNGRPQPIRRTARAGSQTYSATVPENLVGTEQVTIACAYRVLVKQHGHLLYLDLPRPTKGLRVQFAYGGCGIRTLDAVDFIASAEQARVLRTPETDTSPSVDIGFDGWIFPKSGMAFVWSLDDETPEPAGGRHIEHRGMA